VIKAQIWDTAGQERFKALTRGYYRGALGALLVYSIANKQSFENCETWLEELVTHADPGIMVMLVGNKTDLEHQREIPLNVATDFAQKNKLLFVEASAKDNTNVVEAFERLIQEIYKQVNSPHNTGSASDHDDTPVPPSGSGTQKIDPSKHMKKPTDTKPNPNCAC